MTVRVLHDVDGVLANFLKATLIVLEELGGPRVDPLTFHEWDLLKTIPAEFHEGLWAAWRSPGFCADLEAYPGAQDGVKRLKGMAEVFFVTSPMGQSPHWMWERDRWLRQLVDATSHEIVFMNAKHIVTGDVLIDDKPDHVLEWKRYHPGGTGVLWAQSYNRHTELPEGVIRTNSWAHVHDIVGGLSEARST